MNFYHKWMASSYQRALFKFAARLGYWGWNAFSFGVCCFTPIMLICVSELSDNEAMAMLIVCTCLGCLLGLTGMRYFASPDADIWIQLELERGILGVHMWKRFPSRLALESVAIEAVKLASELNFKLVRIESPLLVKPGRLSLWGATLRRCLSDEKLPVVHVDNVIPKRMDFMRAISFMMVSRAMGFDQESKHLPKDAGLGCPTAGFHLRVAS